MPSGETTASAEPGQESEGAVTPAASGARDWWGRLGPITTFVSSVIIGGAGVLATHLYNNAQLSLKREEIAGQLELKKRELEGQLALKDREESRHTKVELTEALDKYAHYMFSADPQQREFGYNLFAQLGFAEIALKLAQTTADQAIRRVAENQVSSKNPVIQHEAEKTLAILTGSQRTTIRHMILRFEGTDSDAGYGSAYLDPSGKLVFGILSWPYGTSGFDDILTRYAGAPDAAHTADLIPWLDKVKSHDQTVASDRQFLAVLKVLGGDDAMRHIQDEAFDKGLDDTLAITNEYGLKQPLSIAAVHDTRFNQGLGSVKAFAATASKELGGSPASGTDEAAWIAKFLDLRIRYLKERLPQFRGLQVRVQQYVDLVAKGDWRLEKVGARATEPAEEH